jgi:glycosyltransferase involved in cell wall biosynthesis
MKRPILFFKTGAFSHINENVRRELERAFPEHGVRVIDVLSDILRARPWAVARALLDVVRIYPREIFLNRRKPLDYLLRTPAAFRVIQRWVEKNVDPAETPWTFQTQSLFDAHRDGLAHFVYTDHTCAANQRYGRPVSPELVDPRWLAVERTIYQAADRTFTTSRFAADSLMEDHGMDPSRAVCVYSGTNAGSQAAVEKTKEFQSRVLFVGIDWERKGGPDLLKAFERVLEAHPQARLRILGCAPRVSSPRIEVLGKVPLAEVGRHFAESDVFCLPSYFEPSATVFAEAMHHGLPVVSTFGGGTPDRVLDGETGYLVRAGDVTALAEALLRLLQDPDRARAMGQAGLRLARDRFSWPVVGDRMAAEIRAVLDQRGAAESATETGRGALAGTREEVR